MNNKVNKSQILMLSLLAAALLFITLLLSSSLSPTSLYFIIINLLIVALGAEAGLLSVFSKPPPEEKKHYSSSVSVSTKPALMVTPQEGSSEVIISASLCSEKKVGRVVEKSASAKIASGAAAKAKVKKCPSMPSLFFIGGGETEPDQEVLLPHEDAQYDAAPAAEEVEEEGEEVLAGKVLSGQELFTKAENLIGNFYKQLKMQREDSWKRIHGFYQKAF